MSKHAVPHPNNVISKNISAILIVLVFPGGRIRAADAAARSTLRELFLSSWGGMPIDGTVTLPELYDYANEWLLPAPPLIETEAASAIAQLSPNMASVPAELLHCL